MNVMVISTVAYSPNGITTVIHNLYANKMFSNDKVRFIFPLGGDESLLQELRDLGYTVLSGMGRNADPLKYMIFLKRQMESSATQIVHIHCNSATCLIELLAAKLAGVPHRITHAHSCSGRYAGLHALLKPAVKSLTTVPFACSREAGQFLFGSRACTIIKNAINADAYCYDPEIREVYRCRYELGDKLVLGHVGTFHKLKNQMFLLDVLKEVKRVRENTALVLVGGGPELDVVRKKARVMGLADSVVFTGSMTDTAGVLNMMDCFLFPSLSEGFGIAPVEAQANGLPVIAAKGRMPEKVRINENFCFVELEKGAAYWSDKILTMELQRQEGAAENVKRAGFGRADTVTQLRDIMTALVER